MYKMDKTNTGLVEFALKQVGYAHYWFGCYGQLGTNALWSAKSKVYPQHYTAKRKEIMKKRGDIGKPVCDCSGLIKWYLMLTDKGENFPPQYNSKYDISADGFYNKATEKGDIKTIPEIVGLAVQRKGHIGIYIGNGKVVEAKGFDYGVVITDLKGSSFTHWLKIPYITYKTEAKPTGGDKKVSVTLTRLSKGSKGAEVLSLQALLNAKNNAGLKLDGDFGNATEKASIAYMKKMGLEPDGIVGTGTWTALLTK